MPIPTSDWLPVSGPSSPILQTLGSCVCRAPYAGTAKEVMSRADPPRVRASFWTRCRIELPALRRPARLASLYGRGLETCNRHLAQLHSLRTHTAWFVNVIKPPRGRHGDVTVRLRP